MKREIKFRIYSTKQKRYYGFDIPIYLFGTWDVTDTFQQYSGLKDTFDNEIYEGDILENGSGRKFIVEWTYLGFEFREIEYIDGKIKTDRVVNYIGDVSNYCRVIGNIMENREELMDDSNFPEFNKSPYE